MGLAVWNGGLVLEVMFCVGVEDVAVRVEDVEVPLSSMNTHSYTSRNTYKFQPSLTTSTTASLNISQPLLKSACVMFRGGMNRITSYIDVVRMSMPFSMQRFATRLASDLGADVLRTGS